MAAKFKGEEILPSLLTAMIRAGQMTPRTLPVRNGLMVFWFSAWRNPRWKTLQLSSRISSTQIPLMRELKRTWMPVQPLFPLVGCYKSPFR